jgi:hypothetical protein
LSVCRDVDYTNFSLFFKGKMRRKYVQNPSIPAVSAEQALLTCREGSEDEPFYTAEQADQETTEETL